MFCLENMKRLNIINAYLLSRSSYPTAENQVPDTQF